MRFYIKNGLFLLIVTTLFSSLQFVYEQTVSWADVIPLGHKLEDLRFGDFDGDGRTDVFVVSGQQLQYSPGGVGSWTTSPSCVPDIKLESFTVITETCEKHQCEISNEYGVTTRPSDTTQEQCKKLRWGWVCKAYKKIEVFPTSQLSRLATCLEGRIEANNRQRHAELIDHDKNIRELQTQIISSINTLPDQLLPATVRNPLRDEILAEVIKLMEEKNEQLQQDLLIEIQNVLGNH